MADGGCLFYILARPLSVVSGSGERGILEGIAVGGHMARHFRFPFRCSKKFPVARYCTNLKSAVSRLDVLYSTRSRSTPGGPQSPRHQAR